MDLMGQHEEYVTVQLKKAKEEEERSKEQRRATLAATRRPGAAGAVLPAASAEAATPSTSHPGDCLMQSSRFGISADWALKHAVTTQEWALGCVLDIPY